MKKLIRNIIALFIFGFIFSCGETTTDDHGGHDDQDGHDHKSSTEKGGHGEHEDEIHFSEEQFQAMGISVDTISRRNMGGYILANGQLEVPPQSEASVSAVIGANVRSIEVIEGDKVKKGQVLAYLTHPEIIELQTDYSQKWNELNYSELEYNRQKTLYEEKVSSGKEFQKIKFEFQALKSQVNGLKAKLSLLGLSVSKIEKGEIFSAAPIRSPISGHIRLVEVKTSQFVRPETEMFEIVNIDHIHADLMVYEKDMNKVAVGQKVLFTLPASNKEVSAEIYSIGKAFEEAPKAVHLHAEIENKEDLMIPGTYIQAKILTDEQSTMALPEEAVSRQNNKTFVFEAKEMVKNGRKSWTFFPIEVQTGIHNNGWIQVQFNSTIKSGTKFAQNNAYYILADWRKEEVEHSH